MRSYHAKVLFDGAFWTASVVDADGAHTYSRTLRGLDREVAEAIRAAEDLADDAEFAVEYDDRDTGEEVRAAVLLGEKPTGPGAPAA